MENIFVPIDRKKQTYNEGSQSGIEANQSGANISVEFDNEPPPTPISVVKDNSMLKMGIIGFLMYKIFG